MFKKIIDKLFGTEPKSKKLDNPYKLIWYRQGWSENKIAKNNLKYWEFEVKYNGLELP